MIIRKEHARAWVCIVSLEKGARLAKAEGRRKLRKEGNV
jgi:hypothetical protein